MTSLHERLLAGFAGRFGGSPAFAARAPGRVNLIGEHTDYNDGFALPVAIPFETQVAFRPGGDRLCVVALDLEEDDEFVISEGIARVAGWRSYVRGVVHELVRAGVTVPNGQIVLAGNLSRGTGLSSSASLEVALATLILGASGTAWNPLQIALLAQAAECDFVGVRCGNLDQIAAAATLQNHALLIDCRSLEFRQIPMPEDVAILIIQSGITRGLLDGEYNLRRRQCERAAHILGVSALRDADEAMLDRARTALDEVDFRRARHIITENRRTLEAAEALAGGDLVAMGQLMRAAQDSQAHDFGITVPHTEQLAELLNQIIGEQGGARQTGGGFGGAVVALLRRDRVDAVRAAIQDAYLTPAGTMPEIVMAYAAGGAAML